MCVKWTEDMVKWMKEEGWGLHLRPKQEVRHPVSWGSHVRMWPSSALSLKASAPSVHPAGHGPRRARRHPDTYGHTKVLSPRPTHPFLSLTVIAVARVDTGGTHSVGVAHWAGGGPC